MKHKPTKNPLARVKPIKRPHDVIHQAGEWALYHIHGNQWPWYNLKYARTRPNTDGNPRNTYWLSWSVEDSRFAHTDSLRHFREHSPMILKWIEDWLPAHFLKKVMEARTLN